MSFDPFPFEEFPFEADQCNSCGQKGTIETITSQHGTMNVCGECAAMYGNVGWSTLQKEAEYHADENWRRNFGDLPPLNPLGDPLEEYQWQPPEPERKDGKASWEV